MGATNECGRFTFFLDGFVWCVFVIMVAAVTNEPYPQKSEMTESWK